MKVSIDKKHKMSKQTAVLGFTTLLRNTKAYARELAVKIRKRGQSEDLAPHGNADGVAPVGGEGICFCSFG